MFVFLGQVWVMYERVNAVVQAYLLNEVDTLILSTKFLVRVVILTHDSGIYSSGYLKRPTIEKTAPKVK